MHPIDLWHFLESDRFDIKNTTSEVLKEPQSPEKNHAGSTWSKNLPSPQVLAPPHSKTNMLHSQAVKMAFEKTMEDILKLLIPELSRMVFLSPSINSK